MAETAPPYEYAPLNGPRNIRVLILRPAKKPDLPISCSFQETTIGHDEESLVPYEALSYTWGARSGTKPILCEGRTVLVTPNCEQALLHLRHKSKPRTLWIDAICIAQNSIEEKNQQVPMMGEIYLHASQTIMWLGSGTDQQLLTTLRHAAKYGEYVNGLRRTYRRIRKRGEGGYESHWEARLLNPVESERIADLCSNEWFGRMWTIQEFLLSKSPVFLMGGITCPEDALFTYYCLGKNIVLRPDLEHFRMRHSLRTETPEDIGDSGSGHAESFLTSIIKLAALNKTTDPRDKVYGMVAYLESRWPAFQTPKVDYAKSVPEIYETFTRALIISTKTLWPLLFITNTPPSPSPAVPSWVLDLRDPDRLSPAWGAWQNRAGFSMKDSVLTIHEDIPGQLTIRVKQIGKILRTSSQMPFWSTTSKKITAQEMDDARLTCLTEWTAFVMDLDIQEDPKHSPYSKHSNAKPWRSWDHFSRSNRSDGEYCFDPNMRALEHLTSGLDYLRFRHQLKDDVSLESWPPKSEKKKEKKRNKKWKERRKEAAKDSSFFESKIKTHDMCRLFYMSTGHIGESPGDICEGDSVFVVQGSEFPFILRRQGRGWRVVGKAYVHQMKDQKDWNPTKLDDDEKARDIVLV